MTETTTEIHTHEEPEAIDSTTFDINAWLDDAHMPEDSCDVYKRPDLIAEISEVSERLKEEADAEEAAGKTIAGGAERAKLRARYDQLLTAFGDSRARFYVRAVSPKTLREIDAEVAEAKKKHAWSKEVAELERASRILSAAIVGIRPAEGDRQKAAFTPEQIQRLESAIGSSQIAALNQAWARAQSQNPEVTVDFLSKRSGINKTDTDD